MPDPHSNELLAWLDPLLTDDEWALGIDLVMEARAAAPSVPTADAWA